MSDLTNQAPSNKSSATHYLNLKVNMLDADGNPVQVNVGKFGISLDVSNDFDKALVQAIESGATVSYSTELKSVISTKGAGFTFA